MLPPHARAGALAVLLVGVAVAAASFGAPPQGPLAPSTPAPDPAGARAALDELHRQGSTLPGHDAQAGNATLPGGADYRGPDDAAGVFAACPDTLQDRIACYVKVLNALLAARGAVAAFDVLENMSRMDAVVAQQSHGMAHELGRHAVLVYGSIGDALTQCSHKVFGGCLHGALQIYFERNRDASLSGVAICPPDTLFREYTCYHGVGHGLMLATDYALNYSLQMCDELTGAWAQSSCHGGVFMENVVGYFNSLGPVGNGQVPADAYKVKKDEHAYPCSAVAPRYRDACWLIQTSLVLYLNGADFPATARTCAGVEGPWDLTCFKSMGRDASVYKNRDPPQVAQVCSLAPAAGREQCIRGFGADVVLYYADPHAALPACAALPEQDKGPCHDQVGREGRLMLDAPGMEQVCARAEPAYAANCRQGAGLA